MFRLWHVGPIIIVALFASFGTNAFAVQAGVAAGVTGKATIEGNDRPGPQVIKSGGAILTNDTLNTSANARMQALLVDETALTLGPNSSLTIDKFVYDPNIGSGEMVANMVRGSLRFVSGRSSALGKPQFKIKTPVGVMGIRGTSTIIVEREQGQSFFMGLVGPGPDNNVGLPPSKIEFANEYGSQTVDKAGVGFFVEINQPPGDLIPVPAEISNLFVNKTPETAENQEGGEQTAENQEGEGGEETAENQEGEGGEETAENQEGEGGEETAENQEGEGGEQTAENQEGEGGEQTAQNQEGEGGEQTAQNQEGEGGQQGESAAANGEGGPPAEGGDGTSEGPAGSDNAVIASASDNESGETGPVDSAGNDAAPAPAEAPVAGGPDNGAGADVAPAPAPALGGDPALATGGGLGGDTQVALAPVPETADSLGGGAQVTLAPTPEMPVFVAINVEEAAGPGVDIAIPVFVGFGPPGAVGPGTAGPNDTLPVENVTQIANDDVQTDIAANISAGQSVISSDLVINTSAFIEFDWTNTSLSGIDGFLFGEDSTVSQPFLIMANESDPNAPSSIFLDRDCDAISCSEVITVSVINGTGSGLYGVGMHLPNADSTSTDFTSNRENLFVRVNQGGSLQRAANGGSNITGGTTVARFNPPSTGTGNTWFAAQINPVDGKISEINQIFNVTGNTAIDIQGFSELTEIANRVDTVQSIVNETLNIALATMLEFNWSNTSLIDLDAHLNGPNASVGTFHVFFSNTSQENVTLANDCASSCASSNSAAKSEVITISSFNQGGLYRASLFDFAGQNISNNGAFVNNRDNIFLKIVQGGTLQRGSNGSATISGGTEIIKISPPTSGTGNTWVAANIDPTTGQVQVVNKITSFSNSSSVTGIVSQ